MSRKEYRSEEITITFDPKRCIHSEECVQHLQSVFDPDKRPWIQPENSTPEAVARTVVRCPTGALEIASGPEKEVIPERNEARLAVDGPTYIRGDIEIKDHDGNTVSHETRVAICRCGASENKPFCDNSHLDIAFHHDGSIEKDLARDDSISAGPLTLQPARNGPLLMRGEIEFTDPSGETRRGNKASLCRCGYSENKPFCDGSHSRNDWIE